MMKRLLLILLLIMPLLFTATPDEGALNEFFQSRSSDLEELQGETSSWVKGQVGGTGAAVGIVGSMIEAFGPGQCGDEWIGGGDSIISMWIAPAVAVIMIVLIGIAILYMLGQLFSLPNLIAIAKDEAFQAGVTVSRVMIILIALSTGHTWFMLAGQGSTDLIYSNPNTTSMMDAAMAFARLMVGDMVNHYSMLVMYNMVVHTIFSSTMWFGVTWRAMYSFNLGPVLKPLIDIIGSALQFLSLGISEWILHIVVLCIIKKWAWGLFIPVGVLLRSIPYTRNGGEALMALMFALVFFYPFMFIFDYEVHKVLKYNLVDPADAMDSFINKSGILNVFGPLLVIMFLMAGVFIPFFLGSALTLAFALIKGAVYYVVIMSLLLPFINIFVTLTVAKESAAFFRVDVNFMSFLKII